VSNAATICKRACSGGCSTGRRDDRLEPIGAEKSEFDRNIVACSPATVYRVLAQAGLLQRWKPKTSLKGTGFVQPLRPHEHWHVDVSYLNIAGTFHYLCSVLDGASRAIVHWDIRERMTEADIEQIIQKGKECHPGVTPRIITDNGPQFLAKVGRPRLIGIGIIANHLHDRHDYSVKGTLTNASRDQSLRLAK
jgi:transposase InsO family protein